jgi:hypothetical protein
MVANEKRSCVRRSVDTPLYFDLPREDRSGVARLLNISPQGVFFESDHPVKPGQDIHLVVPSMPSEALLQSPYAAYQASTCWYAELSHKRRPSYGVGAQLLDKIEEMKRFSVLEQPIECDLCCKSFQTGSILRWGQTVRLCTSCSDHLAGIPEGVIRSSVLRFLDGNVL